MLSPLPQPFLPARVALNTGNLNKTYHAEVNLLQEYTCCSGRNMPAGAFIYTTMKPCDMCGAMIKELLPDCTVVYLQDDPRANPDSPTGGMWQLTSCTDKPVRSYDTDLTTKRMDLNASLAQVATLKQQGTKKGDHNYYLTNVVDSREAFESMASGLRSLHRKVRKYQQYLSEYDSALIRDVSEGEPNVEYPKDPKHREVLAVLRHVAALLGLDLYSGAL